jgi:RNA polymerase sigma-70 factor, ECF subfamily
MSQSSRQPVSLERWRPYLRTLARIQIEDKFQAKIDASDIVQQTMLEAHRGLEQFRGQNDKEVAGWLRQIMARNLADEVRKYRCGKRDAGMEQSLQAALATSSMGLERFLDAGISSPDNRAIRNEQLLKLASAIDELPDDQRLAVTLHHLQAMPSAEIAVQMGKTEVAVAGLLRRGLKRLREVLCEPEDQ